MAMGEGSVAKFDFRGKIRKPGISNSMTYRHQNSRKSNFATEPLGDSKAFVECVLAFLLSLGFQLKHQATCRGGCLTRHSHYLRVRLGGVSIWRLQGTTCRAVFTVPPAFRLALSVYAP